MKLATLNSAATRVVLVLSIFALHAGGSTGIAGVAIRTDLRHDDVTTIEGVGMVRSVGDVNGDGNADVVAGICVNPHLPRIAGAAQVIFGPIASGHYEPNDLPGFVIEGWSEEQWACHVAAGGDINGDGLSDLLVGAYNSDNNAREDSGSVYVVFGKADSETIQLRDFDEGTQGSQGFRIDGPSSYSLTGYHIDFSAAGDVNGDGYNDVAVGAVFAGSAYVIFGQPTPMNVDLLTYETNSQGPRGFRIDFPTPDRSSGFSIAGAGDVNGDGFDDVIVGLIPRVLARRGQAHVIFGKSDPLPVDVKSLGTGGFAIRGLYEADWTGWAVADAGDVNGDGLADILIGAPKTPVSCCPGVVAVVFGKRDSNFVSLRKMRDDGYRIRGIADDAAGMDVANAGDLNGDGVPDQVIAATYGTYKGRIGAGAAYVVWGKKNSGAISITESGRGYMIIGPHRGSQVAGYVDGNVDLTGDGILDVLISDTNPGRTYIISTR